MSEAAGTPAPVDWQAKYTELDKLRGTMSAELGTLRGQVETLTKSARPAMPDDLDVNGLVTQAGLKPEDIQTTLTQHGKLTDEQIAAIAAKHGVSKKLTAEIFERDAKQRAGLSHMAKEAGIRILGGEEQLNNFWKWHAARPAEQRAEADRLMASGTTFFQGFDKALGDHRQSVGAGGSAPLLNGTGAAPSGAQPFASLAEIEASEKALGDKGISWFKDPTHAARLIATPDRIKRAIR